MTRNALDVGGPLNALSPSPNKNMMAVAGRDVLKIVSIVDDEDMTVVKNFRVGKEKNMNLNYSSTDVRWHPQAMKIATAATNGAVVIWNIGENQPKQEKVISEHNRTVNRICWHPESDSLLLSGSQDGTIRLWDRRDPNNKKTFLANSDSVRDVQFNPFYSNYFACAFENGTVQIWDIRKQNACERKITAHQGLVFTVDWHPEDRNMIASGGRDRMIKVWDLTNTSKPTATIQTISSVARIQWRPNHRNHIASSASLMDFNIHIWDMKRPYFPFASFTGHKDVATGIQWFQGDTLMSCGKDSFLMKHHISEAYRPVQHMCATSMSWTASGDLAVIHDPINRNPQESDATGNTAFSFFPFATPSASQQSITSEDKGLVKFYAAQEDSELFFDKKTFVYLAQHYRLSTTNLKETCLHNFNEAKAVGQHQIAQTWQVLMLLYGEQSKENTIETTDEHKSELDTTTELLQENGELDKSSSQIANLSFSLTSLSSDPLDPLISTVNEQSESDELDKKNIGLDLKSESIEPSFLSMEAIGPVSPSPIKPLSRVSTPSVKPLAAIADKSISKTASPTLEENSVDILKSNNVKSNKTNKFGVQEFPLWNHDTIVRDTLSFYADSGDIQTCVTICLVLGGRINFERTQIVQWFSAYIDILHRFQLWVTANEVISKCDAMKIMNQQSTTYYSGCPFCLKPLLGPNPVWACENCKKITSSCVICHQPVKGVFVWCQGCGHGGHANHISQWFSKEKRCPSGCGHICTILPSSRGPSLPSSSTIQPTPPSAAISLLSSAAIIPEYHPKITI
eukprot:TRINITY_DN7028_c0_g1_i1.p1 TRINITY_DN7028_c0_g1~~TRINITY_DN7028_c0_g1_i1.p1  ORF type:complete len:798 (-),score=135.63 TRINITY_DN7028_c0_g1_i1:38-2431(-)